MARIKNNLTGDVFEGPARDFANEADFTIVDSSTPLTDEPPVAVSDTGEPVTPASAPAEQASSGSTDTPAATPSLDLVSTQIDPTISTMPASTSTNTPDGTAPSVPGDAGNVAADANVVVSAPASVTTDPNVGASTPPAGAVTDVQSQAAALLEASAKAGALADQIFDQMAATGSIDPATFEQAKQAGNNLLALASATTLNPIMPPVTDSVNGNPTGGPTPGNGNTLDARGKHIVADQLEADILFALAQIITPTDSLRHSADAFFDQVRSQIDVEAAS